MKYPLSFCDLSGCQLPKEIPTIKSIDNATHDMTKWFATKQDTLFAKYEELISVWKRRFQVYCIVVRTSIALRYHFASRASEKGTVAKGCR